MHATQQQGAACPEPTRPTNSQPASEVVVRFLDLFESDDVAEAYGQNELDYDRVPTRDGFAAWCAKQVSTTDGWVVTDAGLRALTGAPGSTEVRGSAGRVLRSAAVYLERYGWIQGAYYDSTATVFTPAACMVGAIGMVCYGGPLDAPAQHFDDPGYLDFEEAVLHLDRYLLVEDGSEAYAFNDAKGRTVDDITRVLRRAAAYPARELIDALRAIEAGNAEVAAIAHLLTPCGIWGEPTPVAGVEGGDAR